MIDNIPEMQEYPELVPLPYENIDSHNVTIGDISITSTDLKLASQIATLISYFRINSDECQPEYLIACMKGIDELFINRN